MRYLVTRSAFRAAFVVIAAMLILFSCSDDGDKRQAVKDDYGEPDDIIKSEYAGIKSELYIYARRDINRAYEFRKTVSSCGGSGEWYVYRMYYADYLGYELYMPPQVTHEPVTQSPPGEKVTITAVITDDIEVISATLFYRGVGDEEFVSDRMVGGEENTYSVSIPGDAMTGGGVEYYIEAYDDAHETRLPENGYYTIAIAPAGEGTEKAAPETAPWNAPPPAVGSPEDPWSAPSPVGP